MSCIIFPGLNLCSARYGVAFIIHICNFIATAQQNVMSITMVAMVNSTDHRFLFNGSTEGLPGDSFRGLNDTPDSLPAGVSNARFKLCSCFCCCLFVCLFFFRASVLKSFIGENSDLKASERSKEVFSVVLTPSCKWLTPAFSVSIRPLCTTGALKFRASSLVLPATACC